MPVLRDLFRKKESRNPLYILNNSKTNIEESKSKVLKNTKLYPSNIGEEHPTDFKSLEKWYNDDPFVHGMIEKHVDFITGGGFFIRSKDSRVKEVLNMFLYDFQFQTVLNEWVRRALSHNGYIEISGMENAVPTGLKVLDGKGVFIKRDEKGELIEYNQWLGILGGSPVSFKPHEIAHLSFNKSGDCPYGHGIIHPLVYALKKKTLLINDMATLMKRKANDPYIITVGDREKGIIPDASQVDAIIEKLEYLDNRHEWVFDAYTDVKSLSFGSLGDKFTSPLELINQELLFGSQVPAVLMGLANVPEGLAGEQMKAWLFRIRSLQEEIERVVEEKILKRVLIANGLPTNDVEFEWGLPTPEDKREESAALLAILDQYSKGNLSDATRKDVEKRLREVLGFEELPPEMIDELKEPQPFFPPQNLKRPFEGIYESVDLDEIDNAPLREYLGFNYQNYLEKIFAFIKSEEFESREFISFTLDGERWTEIVQRYDLKEALGVEKLGRLREVLIDSLQNGESVSKIARKIEENVRPGDMTVDVPEVTDSEGNTIRKAHVKTFTERSRSLNIARTESTRVANQGALRSYEELGAGKVMWIAGLGDRTCPYCNSQNGSILSLTEANERIPSHNKCRCGWAPIRE